MDTRTGQLYTTMETALAEGVPEEHLVQVSGPPSAVQNIARTYEELQRLKQQQAKEQLDAIETRMSQEEAARRAKHAVKRKKKRKAEKQQKQAQVRSKKRGR